jgi:hypothetical protein
MYSFRGALYSESWDKSDFKKFLRNIIIDIIKEATKIEKIPKKV